MMHDQLARQTIPEKWFRAITTNHSPSEWRRMTARKVPRAVLVVISFNCR